MPPSLRIIRSSRERTVLFPLFFYSTVYARQVIRINHPGGFPMGIRQKFLPGSLGELTESISHIQHVKLRVQTDPSHAARD